MNLYPFSVIFDGKTQYAAFWPICCKYAAVCSTSNFLGIMRNNCLILLKNDSNNNFQSIWSNFQSKNQYAAFFTRLQQVCSSVQQQGLFLVLLITITLFWLQNILDIDFLCIQCYFWWKKPLCSILACMQHICSSMQQH